MFCWHKWEKWSNPYNGVWGKSDSIGYFKVCQYRVCSKCGKASVRKIPELRTVDSLKKVNDEK